MHRAAQPTVPNPLGLVNCGQAYIIQNTELANLDQTPENTAGTKLQLSNIEIHFFKPKFSFFYFDKSLNFQ